MQLSAPVKLEGVLQHIWIFEGLKVHISKNFENLIPPLLSHASELMGTKKNIYSMIDFLCYFSKLNKTKKQSKPSPSHPVRTSNIRQKLSALLLPALERHACCRR